MVHPAAPPHHRERRDGRLLRSERSRRAIVEAMLAWVDDGVAEPTAQQVADRAGVGIRSVFRHFEDMDTLYAELADAVREKVRPLIAGVPARGPVPERLREMVRRRAALFERIAPYKRSTDRHRAQSPFLERRHRRLARQLRAALRGALPELAREDGAREEALDLVLSFEAWDRLRSEQRLGAAEAVAVLENMALAVWRAPQARGLAVRAARRSPR